MLGWTSRELRRILYSLVGLNIVAMDIVELSPAYDSNGTYSVQTEIIANLQVKFRPSQRPTWCMISSRSWLWVLQTRLRRCKRSVMNCRNVQSHSSSMHRFRPNEGCPSEGRVKRIWRAYGSDRRIRLLLFLCFYPVNIVSCPFQAHHHPARKHSNAMSPQSSDESTQHTPPDPGERSGENQSENGRTEAGRKRRKVTRSRAGCLTCRKRRKLCDMGKPDCGACERLRMVSTSAAYSSLLIVQECVWPELRTLESDPIQRRGSTSGTVDGQHSHHMTPVRQFSTSSVPASSHPLSFRRESFQSTSAPPQQFPPQTEQSAVDGLMNLFSSDSGVLDEAPYPTLAFPHAGNAPSITPQPPAIPISHPVVPSQQTNSLETFGADNMFNADIFSFDDVSR